MKGPVFVCGTAEEFAAACARVEERGPFTAPEAISPVRMLLVYEDLHGERLSDIVRVDGARIYDAKGRCWEVIGTLDRQQYADLVARALDGLS